MLVFFFTDIEGSTRLWEEHTDDMGGVIARHDAILQQQIAQSGGRITKHTGDGVTAAFDGGQPLACALEAQEQFAAADWGPIGELRIRIGLHAGEGELLHGDYFGPAVNCTARIMSAGWGGQILLTPEVHAVSPLPAQATLRDMGTHLLKNVSAAQQIYQLLHPDLSLCDFPPLRTLSGTSIQRTVDQQGQQFAGLAPPAIAARLVSATLLPTLLGDVSPSAPALAGNLGILADLGAHAMRGWMVGFAKRLQAQQQAGQAVTDMGIREQLEVELLQRWQSGGEVAAALRADASKLLQAVRGVQAALQAGSAEVRETLAQGLADLGGQFEEFRWMLSGLQDTLAEMHTRQAMQIALQKEQLDLQRQQLVKTNLILRRQQALQTAAPLAMMMEEEEELAPADTPCPYKGLAAFQAEDAEYFFGREELLAELTARLPGTRFLSVVGPSGSGKSSLVRAGLLPAIWKDALPGSNHWQTLVLTPGHHPLNELAVRISLLDGFTPGALLRDLEADHRGLDLAIRRLLADQPEGVRLLLVVDQFEEIFALCRDEEERCRFIDALVYAAEAEGGRTIVLPTIRADFFGRCADYPQLASRQRDSVLVGPLSEDELREVIERPAELVGLRLEPGLVDTIVADVADEPGALPLLSHALLETWQRRRGRTLTLAGYARSGGVAGAIAQTADTVYGQLQPQQQAIARNIVVRLTELGEEGTHDTRRRVAPAELIPRPEEAPTVEAVLKTLADARLITTSEDTVEVAHEALIREWPTLRSWLDEDREGLRTHRHLTKAAQEWERLDREPGELYRGARLATASEWEEQHADLLNPLEREFLAASQRLAWSQELERQRRRQRTMMGLAAALAITLILALLAVRQSKRAEHGEQQALLQASAGLAARAVAELEGTYPERGVLLALEALQDYPYTPEAQRALAQAVRARVPYRVLPSPGRDVVSAVWSPVGQRIAAAAPGESLVVWNAETGYEVWRATLGAGFVGDVSWGLGWAPAGDEIATCASGWLLIFDAATGALLRRLNFHPVSVASLAWSPNGDRFVVSTPAGNAQVWDSTPEGHWTGSDRVAYLQRLVLPEHGGAVMDSGWSPTGERICTASTDGTAKVWDAETGSDLLTLFGHDGAVLAVAWSPDGQQIATAGMDGTARAWDVSSGEELLRLTGHSDEVRDVAWSPDGQCIATTSPDGTTRVWSAQTGQELFVFPGTRGELQTVAWSARGDQLVTGGGPAVTLWQLPADELGLVGHTGDVLDARWSPDGARIVTAGADGTARLWDATTGELLLEFSQHEGAVHSAAWSPSGEWVVTTGADGTARIWDADSGEEILVFSEHDGDVWHADWSPNGQYVVTTGGDADAPDRGVGALVWDATTGEMLRTLYPGLDRGRSQWAPDGQRIVTAVALGGSYKPVWVWEAATGKRLVSFDKHEDWTNSADWSPDGERVVSAGYDATARVWDSATGEQLVVLVGHSAVVNDADWSPDGKHIVTGDDAGEVKVWDAATGGEIDGFVAAGAVLNVDWSPDGRYIIASGHFNPTVVRRVWINVDELIAHAGQCCLSRELTPEERAQFDLQPE